MCRGHSWPLNGMCPNIWPNLTRSYNLIQLVVRVTLQWYDCSGLCKFMPCEATWIYEVSGARVPYSKYFHISFANIACATSCHSKSGWLSLAEILPFRLNNWWQIIQNYPNPCRTCPASIFPPSKSFRSSAWQPKRHKQFSVLQTTSNQQQYAMTHPRHQWHPMTTWYVVIQTRLDMSNCRGLLNWFSF